MLPLETIHQAQSILRQHLSITRLVPAASLNRFTGGTIHLKLEGELPTGSFKPRGAIYALTVSLRRREVREVVASSTGNHGAAVAYAAKLLGVKATIFLPANPNPVKRARIADLGATIVEVASPDLAGAFEQAAEYANADGVYFLNDATDPDLPFGPATIACEILEAQPGIDTIVVPMGDTALIRGVASAAKQISPHFRIIGVQAERAPSYYLSWKHGKAVATETCDTIADGLATRTPEEQNVAEIRQLVDDIRLVSEKQMLSAIWHLLIHEHIVAEPSGAAATAALMHSAQPVGRNVAALVTGANIAPAVLRLAVNQAMEANSAPR
jgi:threonine dehydratase